MTIIFYLFVTIWVLISWWGILTLACVICDRDFDGMSPIVEVKINKKNE